MGDSYRIDDAIRVVRAALLTASILPAIALAMWRWIPGLQKCTFPYLGGEWTGRLVFEGSRGKGSRDIQLKISHSLFHLTLILETAESASRTLVAHAEYDKGLDVNRIYYVYLTERKEGVPGAGAQYKGLATLRIGKAEAALYGDYFTEQQTMGKLHAWRARPYPAWQFWK